MKKFDLLITVMSINKVQAIALVVHRTPESEDWQFARYEGDLVDYYETGLDEFRGDAYLPCEYRQAVLLLALEMKKLKTEGYVVRKTETGFIKLIGMPGVKRSLNIEIDTAEDGMKIKKVNGLIPDGSLLMRVKTLISGRLEDNESERLEEDIFNEIDELKEGKDESDRRWERIVGGLNAI